MRGASVSRWVRVCVGVAVVLLYVPFGMLTASAGSDRDGDGMPNAWERAHHLNPDRPNAKEDPDRDRLSNLGEYRRGTKPHVDDTDRDGSEDGIEVDPFETDPTDEDSDDDGVLDGDEDADDDAVDDEDEDDATEPCDFDDPDVDEDGIDNEDENDFGTEPGDSDSDDDGIEDGDEDSDLDDVDDEDEDDEDDDECEDEVEDDGEEDVDGV